MKKMLLVLIALMCIGFGAKAQSCDVGNGAYVAVKTTVCGSGSIFNGHIECLAYGYGENFPNSGVVYVTVYFIDKNGNSGSERIPLRWVSVGSDRELRSDEKYRGWHGQKSNVREITDYKVEAGACRWN